MKILITGGASGLGEAITRQLASKCSNVVFFSYNSSVEKANFIENEFSNAIAIQCDFTNKESVASLMVKISEFDIDVIINNAYNGTFINNHFNKIAIEEFENEFVNNILPTIQLTQSAIRHFRKKKSGQIMMKAIKLKY